MTPPQRQRPPGTRFRTGAESVSHHLHGRHVLFRLREIFEKDVFHLRDQVEQTHRVRRLPRHDHGRAVGRKRKLFHEGRVQRALVNRLHFALYLPRGSQVCLRLGELVLVVLLSLLGLREIGQRTGHVVGNGLGEELRRDFRQRGGGEARWCAWRLSLGHHWCPHWASLTQKPEIPLMISGVELPRFFHPQLPVLGGLLVAQNRAEGLGFRLQRLKLLLRGKRRRRWRWRLGCRW
mmetsp:Transcript_457/g.943  ORF Transcript_457/g.943 Transcript_457/m.943 type:complete len:235 (-) Transcript_457:278-982(-)